MKVKILVDFQICISLPLICSFAFIYLLFLKKNFRLLKEMKKFKADRLSPESVFSAHANISLTLEALTTWT